jgi:hypothetical protein
MLGGVCRLFIVAVPNLYAAVGELCGLAHITDGHGDLRRGHPLE